MILHILCARPPICRSDSSTMPSILLRPGKCIFPTGVTFIQATVHKEQQYTSLLLISSVHPLLHSKMPVKLSAYEAPQYGTVLPSKLKNFPVSLSDIESNTFSCPAILSGASHSPFSPPMSVRTWPGHIEMNVMPSDRRSADMQTVTAQPRDQFRVCLRSAAGNMSLSTWPKHITTIAMPSNSRSAVM